MKYIPSLIKLPVLLVLILIIQGCGPGTPGSWKDAEIPADMRETFHDLNNQFMKAALANNTNEAEKLMTAELIESGEKLKKLQNIGYYLKTNKYEMLEEYYVINKYTTNDTVLTKNKTINSHNLVYEGSTEEMYMAYFAPKTGASRQMISLVYCKVNYGWKLIKISAEPYMYNGKTAPELYEEAKKCFNKGYLVDAYLLITLANAAGKPNDEWKYLNNDAMLNFYGEVVKVNRETYELPLIIAGVPTKPRVLRLYTTTLPEGDFPTVCYLSPISLKDTVGVRRENVNIRKVIGNTLKGIDKDKKYIIYSVFNEEPDGKKMLDHIEYTHRLQ
ncbi:hypothetical protein GCM10023149_31480 [Mucilaginibacter gynuensis]|uniref:Lipoprotein n=1 Tax=Mucilaginibacter gynuensis TaxID=1302236 RepID=A0ABP8GP50_9SPHI